MYTLFCPVTIISCVKAVVASASSISFGVLLSLICRPISQIKLLSLQFWTEAPSPFIVLFDQSLFFQFKSIEQSAEIVLSSSSYKFWSGLLYDYLCLNVSDSNKVFQLEFSFSNGVLLEVNGSDVRVRSGVDIGLRNDGVTCDFSLTLLGNDVNYLTCQHHEVCWTSRQQEYLKDEIIFEIPLSCILRPYQLTWRDLNAPYAHSSFPLNWKLYQWKVTDGDPISGWKLGYCSKSWSEYLSYWRWFRRTFQDTLGDVVDSAIKRKPRRPALVVTVKASADSRPDYQKSLDEEGIG